jgi:RNA-binding protein YhbY
MNALHKMLDNALIEAANLSKRSTGELLKEVQSRLKHRLINVRVTQASIRVQHNFNFDKLSSAEDVDRALNMEVLDFNLK